MPAQTQMIAAIVVAWIGPWIASKGIMTSDQFSAFVNGTITWGVGIALPAGAAILTWWKSSHPQLVKAVQASPTEQVVTSDPAVKAAVPGVVLAPPAAKTISVPVSRP